MRTSLHILRLILIPKENQNWVQLARDGLSQNMHQGIMDGEILLFGSPHPKREGLAHKFTVVGPQTAFYFSIAMQKEERKENPSS